MTAPDDLHRGRKHGRQRQNYVVLQQLANGQSLITIPSMWIELLGLSKGDLITFVPGTHGGIEIVPAKKSAKSSNNTSVASVVKKKKK